MAAGKDQEQGGKLLHIGDLAKAVGKSARALHLYEELGLLTPAGRSPGGFRLYDRASVDRVEWILKLQRIGFSLSQIQGFVRDFEAAPSGRHATDKVRAVFREKLGEVREQMAALRASEADLEAALDYLDACDSCSPTLAPVECHDCTHHGHEPEKVPPLFAGLSDSVQDSGYDVDVTTLRGARDHGGSHGVQ